MKRPFTFSVITFILAFCSIVYELIMAQALSAFLENTVLRYSVTIGLYMFSMGIGAFLAEGKITKKPILSLVIIEILLTIIGGFSVVLLYTFDILSFPRWLFSLCAHSIIIIIGILSGYEIPLLINIGQKFKYLKENTVLSIDYIGAFFGTILFAFVFFPLVGLIATTFIIGTLNGIAGILLPFSVPKEHISEENSYLKKWVFFQWVLLFILISCLIQSEFITNYLINLYLK